MYETQENKYKASERSRKLTQQVIEYQNLQEGKEKAELCEKIILENERLIFEIIKHYKGRVANDDLLQEGRIAFYKALQTYNPEKEANFATYCVNGIKIAIYKMLRREEGLVRIPSTSYKRIRELKAAVVQLEQKLYRKPTILELSRETGITVAEIMELGKIPQHVTSLDTPLPDTEDILLKDTLEDRTDYTFQERIEDLDENIDQMKFLRRILTEKELNILSERLGNEKTLEQIAESLHITRERVRQIEKRAIEKVHDACGISSNTIGKHSTETSDTTLSEQEIINYLKLHCTKKEFFAARHMLCLENEKYLSISLLKDICHININRLASILKSDDMVDNSISKLKKGKSRREKIYASNCPNFYQVLQNEGFSLEEIDNGLQTMSNGVKELIHYYYGVNLEENLDWSNERNGAIDLLLSEFIFRPLYAKIIYFREFGVYPISNPQKENAKLRNKIIAKNISLDKLPVLETKEAHKRLSYAKQSN